ncbi:peptidylprolyl isomerase [Paenibacillus campi]|uniref:peptidylprolyl isomerase n=1 Tax=Paenibacillus campi TaxID=3106031 RepID=UPI002AFE2397|nr:MULTISPECIES: peptidylprolyl isomerase [unclassified Paenibacillus]
MLRQRRQWIVLLLMFSALMLVLAGCGNTSGGNGAGQSSSTSSSSQTESGTTGSDGSASSSEQSGSTSTDSNTASASDNSASFHQANDPIVTIEMADGKKIEIELFPKAAPNTVNNFISLVKKGFYDGLTFHRVIPGFMIQGGDPNGNGTGGPGYTIPGEFKANNVQNDLKHTRGIISMARANDPNSGGSQFFIMVGDAPQLDGQYAAFGKVISGMDEVDKIVNLPRDNMDKPNTPPVMKKVTVDTKGVNYPDPEKSKTSSN